MKSTNQPQIHEITKEREQSRKEGKNKELWTPKEIAQMLRISYKVFLRHLKAGRVPGAFQTGTHWKIPSDVVERLMKDGY